MLLFFLVLWFTKQNKNKLYRNYNANMKHSDRQLISVIYIFCLVNKHKNKTQQIYIFVYYINSPSSSINIF